jgi:heat shock protein HslJ
VNDHGEGGALLGGRWAILLTFAFAFLTSCGPKPEPGLTLPNSAWRLESLGRKPVLSGVEPTLAFDSDGRATGDGGCNRFFGSVSTDGNLMRFGPIAATRKSCAEPVMEQEQRYLRALERVEMFGYVDGGLILYDNTGWPVASFLPCG